MTVREARATAQRWVDENVAELPGLSGALLHGSICWLGDDAPFPAGSDVDILTVFEDGSPRIPTGKRLHEGVLLEVSAIDPAAVASPETILGVSHLAGSFRRNGILADPDGRLAPIQAQVERAFAERRWVKCRCNHARSKVLANLGGLARATTLHDRALCWLFAVGVTTHILLCAGLKNPTVRKRYVATRELMERHGRPSYHETLLDDLGCRGWSPGWTTGHLDALGDAFDAAASVIRSPLPFAADLTPAARPIAIDGSRELIERGLHREAVFWIAVTFARCRKVLHDDAPELLERHDPAFRRLLDDLEFVGDADRVRSSLPRIEAMAREIMAANSEIHA